MFQVQSYEKSSEKPNEFELFRVPSNFGAAKSYEKSSAEQNKLVCFLCRDGVTYLKVQKKSVTKDVI